MQVPNARSTRLLMVRSVLQPPQLFGGFKYRDPWPHKQTIHSLRRVELRMWYRLPLGNFDQALDRHVVKMGRLGERADGAVPILERAQEIAKPDWAHGVTLAGPPLDVTPRTN